MIRLLKLLALVALTFTGSVFAATVTFDCNAIPETCNNMCFASNTLAYFQMHYDANAANRPGRRTAAGCLPNPNRCNSNPPSPGRTTCDEYPFASTYGTGAGLGWYSGTGASTRCVSPGECASQGGSLSAFYQSFGSVDQTPVDVVVTGFSATVAPFCANAGMPSDGQFATGGAPPNRRRGVPSQRTQGRHEYKTSGNRTVLSLTGPLSVGTEIFIPNSNWQSNPKVSHILKRQADAPNDDCTGTGAQMAAAAQLSNAELGQTDTIA